MAITKIVLNRQADLILTGATISTPTGILASDIKNGTAPFSPTVEAELSTLVSADASIVTYLDAEVSTEESVRAAGDLSLTTRVSTEESTRTSADTSLTTRVSTEESTRTSADASIVTYLDAEVSTEQSRAESAEDSLESVISTEVSTLNDTIDSEISTEASSRLSGDASLEFEISRINAADFGKLTTTVLVDGSNKDFTLSGTFVADTEFVYLNGLLQSQGDDYTLGADPLGNTNEIKFIVAPELGSTVKFAGSIVA